MKQITLSIIPYKYYMSYNKPFKNFILFALLCKPFVLSVNHNISYMSYVHTPERFL